MATTTRTKMKTKKTEPARQVTGENIREFAEDFLTKHLIVPVKDFDTVCHDAFKGLWKRADYEQMRDKNGKPKDRLVWENRVDWVKAHFTANEKTTYMTFNGVRHLVWMPPVGYLYNRGTFVMRRETLALFDMLIRMMS